ncbi:MAG TPA: hypothetical protein VHU87_09990 [Rhizomicrobium sp.]|jgi:hypothetical protein|nr:hypothetical protein [Rhizomicrobium sp.]
MKTMLLATATLLGLLAIGAASAQTPGGAMSGPPAKRCDRDGCWTYQCDATSNHCHRHWTSATPRDANTPHSLDRGDEVCDAHGENCQPMIVQPR